ncbi:hypothetical protein [Croceimicrobium hydrocarbonivorans]|uniref:DUF4412 domain-containing protein n=1 Tax=Croceimicrobium hydrocarbonivorans TaxID=2761580 RepID=A0A7H0VAB2_9FLAO|nr:hypothetical protein [Croceimicrobium hydrocarbonivorans]QNR22660.1 hypothetical protein H4K34_09715 [Croceimicrobium hydrocarbonivorans]
MGGNFTFIPIALKRILTGLLLLFLCQAAMAQDFYRISGNFSIKSKDDSIYSLTRGSFYYDLNYKKVVYELTFPEKEIWVLSDSMIFRMRGDTLFEKTEGASIVEFSIFHLILNNKLHDYGLKESIYNLKEVEKKKDMIIYTWAPPMVMSSMLGKVLLSQQDKRLYGLIFLNKDEEVLRKQFFRSYTNISGLEFPSEIVDLVYVEGLEIVQKTNYKNIKVNESGNNAMYNYPIPE